MARRFNTLNDCKRYLADTLNRLEAGEIEPDGVKVRSYCTQILSKIIAESNLEERLRIVEDKIAEREQS